MKHIKKIYAVYKTLEAYEIKLRIFFRSQKFEFILWEQKNLGFQKSRQRKSLLYKILTNYHHKNIITLKAYDLSI